ncbi:MAG TPA: DUF4430 domain-containing protein [Solirubrobacterales bacterium]
MTRRRGTAVAIALLLAALATAGCGLGPGEGRGDVELTVTRDYGAESLLDRSVGDVTESDTVMRVLDRSAEITTRYGGGFVQSIDGLEADRAFGDSFDWFFYVNGVEATVGAADYSLRGGERIWWDYREWSQAMRVPAVVGSWPQPFTGGYEGERRPVAVECMGEGAACVEVRTRLRGVGASPVAGSPNGAIRVLVGPWARVREDPAAALIEGGPQASGVFAYFAERGGGFELRGLDDGGEPVRAFGPSAGLVAATRRFDAPPVWVVTGATAAAVRSAADLLDAADLRDHYAVVAEGGREEAVPLR